MIQRDDPVQESNSARVSEWVKIAEHASRGAIYLLGRRFAAENEGFSTKTSGEVGCADDLHSSRVLETGY